MPTTRDGGEHDVGGIVINVVWRPDLRPVEQAGLVGAGHAFKRGNEDDIPFQALGFVDSQEFDARRAVGNCVRFGIQRLQALVENGGIDLATFQRIEQLEEAASVGEFGRGQPGVTAQGAPRALDELRGSEARTLSVCSVQHCIDDGREALAGVVGEQVATVGDQATDGEATGGGVVGSRESMQVGERQATPGHRSTAERRRPGRRG